MKNASRKITNSIAYIAAPDIISTPTHIQLFGSIFVKYLTTKNIAIPDNTNL